MKGSPDQPELVSTYKKWSPHSFYSTIFPLFTISNPSFLMSDNGWDPDMKTQTASYLDLENGDEKLDRSLPTPPCASDGLQQLGSSEATSSTVEHQPAYSAEPNHLLFAILQLFTCSVSNSLQNYASRSFWASKTETNKGLRHVSLPSSNSQTVSGPIKKKTKDPQCCWINEYSVLT